MRYRVTRQFDGHVLGEVLDFPDTRLTKRLVILGRLAPVPPPPVVTTANPSDKKHRK